jgi:hypothetical protein
MIIKTQRIFIYFFKDNRIFFFCGRLGQAWVNLFWFINNFLNNFFKLGWTSLFPTLLKPINCLNQPLQESVYGIRWKWTFNNMWLQKRSAWDRTVTLAFRKSSQIRQKSKLCCLFVNFIKNLASSYLQLKIKPKNIQIGGYFA